MSKKRGLSLEDKRKVILSIYHEHKVPFNLKEIESIASRMGVVQQTIKDVNQSLVDDSLVLSDKIGSANFFWSFPSKAYEDRAALKRSLEETISLQTDTNAKLREALDCAQLTRPTSAARTAKLQRLRELMQTEKVLDAELAANSSRDPEEVSRIQRQVEVNRAAANRWTDNIWVMKKFLTKKKGMAGKEADKILKITSGMDYV